MRKLVVCTSFCLVAFSSVGNPEKGVGAIAPVAVAEAEAAAKSDMRPKDQSRVAQAMPVSVPATDLPVLLRQDLTHFVLGYPVDDAPGTAVAKAINESDADDEAQDAEDEAQPLSKDEVCAVLADAAEANHLPVAFLVRLIWQESRFDPHAVSRAGAQGVAQFMPESAAEAGLANPFDPVEAVPASARMLSGLAARFGNLGLAAAAYNAGAKRIHDWLTRRGRLPSETRDYVIKVTGRKPELWRGSGRPSLDLRIPDRAPCREVAKSAPFEQLAAAVPAPPAPQKAARHHGRHYVRLASLEHEGSERRRRRH